MPGPRKKKYCERLLETGSAYGSRVALFVVKAGAATGWQGRGLGDDDAVKDFPLDMATGPAAHAYQNRTVTPANIAEMDRRFVKQFGGPANERITGPAAGSKRQSCSTTLCRRRRWRGWRARRALPRSTGDDHQHVARSDVAAETSAERPKEGTGGLPAWSASPDGLSGPLQAVSSFSDPFAAHTPKHIAPMAAPEPEPAEVVEVAAHATSASAARAPAAAADPFAGMSPEDAETHRKAQRFARLLVDEIKLYNQAKVAEGRRNKDLYDRLKEDIDKSRSTFQKRYGNTVAASGDYFRKRKSYEPGRRRLFSDGRELPEVSTESRNSQMRDQAPHEAICKSSIIF